MDKNQARPVEEAKTGGTRHSRILPWLCAPLFCWLVYFYVNILPTPPWNSDDWCYLAQFRDMFPYLTRANPARLFPEIFSPLMGWLASVIHAFTGRYIDAVITSHALFMAFFITAFCAALYAALADMLRERALAVFLTLAFLACAFCLFKSAPDDNVFLFHSPTITLSTFYIFPATVNAALTLYIIHGQFTGKNILAGRPLLQGFFVLGLFLAQFSMTVASAIACSYAGFTLLLRLRCLSATGSPAAKDVATRAFTGRLRSLIRAGNAFDAMLIATVAFWTLAAALDMMGGRYGRVRVEGWHFAVPFAQFVALWARLNIVFGIVAGVTCLGCLTRLGWKAATGRMRERDFRFRELLCAIFASALAVAVLLMLISAHTTTVLTGRTSSAYGVFFFFLLFFLFSAAWLLTDAPRLRLLAPVVLALLFVESSNPERPFAQAEGAPYRSAVIQRWVDDVKVAEAQGETNAVILVPRPEWPHPRENFGKRVSRAFFAHGVTRKPMTIILQGTE